MGVHNTKYLMRLELLGDLSFVEKDKKRLISYVRERARHDCSIPLVERYVSRMNCSSLTASRGHLLNQHELYSINERMAG